MATLGLLAALVPGAVLADGSGAISGKVFDNTGAPAATVWVYACAGACISTTSASDGTYTISGLAAGSYRVGIEDPFGKLPGGYATSTGLTLDAAAAALIAVGAAPATFDVHAIAGRLVSGTITATAGGPVQDVLVQACTIVAFPVDPDFLPCGADVTGADGTYALTVLPSTYRVSTYDFGYTHASGYWTPGGYVFSSRLASPLAVGTSDIAGIDLILPPGATIAGSVTGSDASPLAHIAVVACVIPELIGCESTTTAADGSYSVSGLPAGSYEVSFQDATASHPAGYYGATGFTGESAEAKTVVIGATGATGIDVRLPIGQLISGVVTDAAGRPTRVEIDDCTTVYCLHVGTTTEDGSYRFNAAPGRHAIHVGDYSGANLSGYYSTTGVANQLHGTMLTVGSSDLTGINLRLRHIGSGVHPGKAHTGSFVSSTAVRKATYATLRFTLGKTFAGTGVTVLRATKNSSGHWSIYRSVATVVVGSDGNAYYSSKITGTLAFEASLADSLVRGVQVLSAPAYVRSK